MKSSKYNYIVPFGNKYIFFNGITEAFFTVSRKNVDLYRTLLSYPEDNFESFPSFIDKVRAQGFIVEDATDELEIVKQKHEALRKPKRYFLMVLPTYQCNLRCWYCIQKHENLFMSDETRDRVKKLIERKMSDTSIEELQLAWFGGEPLLAYQHIVDVTRFAKKLVSSFGKQFSSSITSNGTLLTPERIKELQEAGINHYQITIDGDRETHNSVKELGSLSAYDRTIENINCIASHTRVSLRLNYTHENLKPDNIIKSLKSKIDPTVVSNISFTIYKVWQEDANMVNEGDVDRLFNLSKDLGIFPNLQTLGLCYAEGVHYNFILPNGKVGICDNHSPDDMPGTLQADGSVTWEGDVDDLYSPHLFDGRQNECQECRYLPICWGPCVAKRDKMLKDNGKINCVYDDQGAHMNRLILNTCKTRLQKTY